MVLRTHDDIKKLLLSHFGVIRDGSNDLSMRIAFSLGVDATVNVSGYSYVEHGSLKFVVVGASPHHKIDVTNLSKEDLLAFIIQCAKRTTEEKYNPSAEVKIAVASFQNTPPDLSPSFILAGLPQTINDSNSWGANVLKACVEAAEEDGNVVVLNESTDGVSCETQWNYTQNIDYLNGKINQLAMTDTNHGIKNHRYQCIGG